MPTKERTVKLTASIDPELHRAIRHMAIEMDKQVREIVIEALRKWLEDQEAQEDLAAYREARHEPTIPWAQVEDEIRAAEDGHSAV
ncbi:MAG: hypothetical protein M1343_05220 [Chloroflexi bacterium]|nr:hypothetical protein [Chloroflexota bacterium]